MKWYEELGDALVIFGKKYMKTKDNLQFIEEIKEISIGIVYDRTWKIILPGYNNIFDTGNFIKLENKKVDKENLRKRISKVYEEFKKKNIEKEELKAIVERLKGSYTKLKFYEWMFPGYDWKKLINHIEQRTLVIVKDDPEKFVFKGDNYVVLGEIKSIYDDSVVVKYTDLKLEKEESECGITEWLFRGDKVPVPEKITATYLGPEGIFGGAVYKEGKLVVKSPYFLSRDLELATYVPVKNTLAKVKNGRIVNKRKINLKKDEKDANDSVKKVIIDAYAKEPKIIWIGEHVSVMRPYLKENEKYLVTCTGSRRLHVWVDEFPFEVFEFGCDIL